MAKRVLHILSQRPSHTGSGITLAELVRHAQRAGWEQCALVGLPAGEPMPDVGPLTGDRVRSVTFGQGDLAFALPGMSDVMPYECTPFGCLDEDDLVDYRRVWSRRIKETVAGFGPDLIHAHHLWIVSSLLPEVAPGIPRVLQSHATGLRQMRLCPHIAPSVVEGCARADAFLALHGAHGRDVAEALAVPPSTVTVVGAGYRSDLFRDPRPGRKGRLLYAGKYSRAKGLPWLLDAVGGLARSDGDLCLHVAGSGSGSEGAALAERMVQEKAVHLHGQLDQAALAAVARDARVAVLPSFFEGLPLVLVEALACGCRLVATGLPGIVEDLAPVLGPWLHTVPLPRLQGPDRPIQEDLPAFTEALALALRQALDAPPPDRDDLMTALAPFTWEAVFERVQAVWKTLL